MLSGYRQRRVGDNYGGNNATRTCHTDTARIMAQQTVEMVVAPGVEGLLGIATARSAFSRPYTRFRRCISKRRISDRYMIDGGLADVW